MLDQHKQAQLLVGWVTMDRHQAVELVGEHPTFFEHRPISSFVIVPLPLSHFSVPDSKEIMKHY